MALAEQRQSRPNPTAATKPDRLIFTVFVVVIANSVVLAALGWLVYQTWLRIGNLEVRATQIEKAQQELENEQSPVGKEFIPKELGTLYPLETFLVNISSDRGPRFLQLQLELELDNPALEDEIALKRPALRDSIILLLSSKTYLELRDPKGMKKLRTDLLREINNLLKSGNVTEVFFTQFHFN